MDGRVDSDSTRVSRTNVRAGDGVGGKSRAARRRLLLLTASVTVGVAALVAINSFTDNLRSTAAIAGPGSSRCRHPGAGP
jgi:hypothetical protein